MDSVSRSHPAGVSDRPDSTVKGAMGTRWLQRRT